MTSTVQKLSEMVRHAQRERTPLCAVYTRDLAEALGEIDCLRAEIAQLRDEIDRLHAAGTLLAVEVSTRRHADRSAKP